MRSSSHWQVTRSPAAGLVLCAIAATVVTAQQGFLNSPAQTKYAAIGLPGGALPAGGGLTRAIGEGDAGNLSPLMVQDKLWEPRCDNAYPNVIHSTRLGGKCSLILGGRQGVVQPIISLTADTPAPRGRPGPQGPG